MSSGFLAVNVQRLILKESGGGSASTVKDYVHVRINILGSPLESPGMFLCFPVCSFCNIKFVFCTCYCLFAMELETLTV